MRERTCRKSEQSDLCVAFPECFLLFCRSQFVILSRVFKGFCFVFLIFCVSVGKKKETVILESPVQMDKKTNKLREAHLLWFLSTMSGTWGRQQAVLQPEVRPVLHQRQQESTFPCKRIADFYWNVLQAITGRSDFNSFLHEK